MPRNAGDPLDFHQSLGRHLVPMDDGGSRQAEFVSYLGEHPALGADQVHTVHSVPLTLPKHAMQALCLPYASNARGRLLAMDVGDKIRAARRRVGWSQRDLASAVGVTAGAVGQWEGGGGRQGISLDNLVEVARVLQMNLSELLGESATDNQFTITDPGEIAMVELARRLPSDLREIHLQLMYRNVSGEAPDKKREPVKPRRVRKRG